MSGEPPVEAPFFQVMPITDFVVTARLFARLTGAEGTKTIVAPFPLSEKADSPYKFVAETFAKMESPSCKE